MGATLGFRRGVSATSLYLLLGCIGLPVFALNSQGNHDSSIAKIATFTDGHLVLGTTGGYLIGFVLAAGLVGRLAELGWDRRLRGLDRGHGPGPRGHLCLGMVWLSIAAIAGPVATLLYGLWPFLPGEAIKLVIAAGLLPIGWRLVERRDHDL